jgi:hypothetical protein
MMWLVAGLVLGLGSLTPVLAQPAPEAALLVQAKQALEKKDALKAIESLKALTEKFPTTPSAAEGTVLWFQLCLDKGEYDQAGVLWKQAFARWPKSDTVWQMIQASCAFQAKKDPAKALTDLETQMQAPTFPPQALIPAQRLRFTYLEQVKPEAFLTDGFTLMQQVSRCQTPEELDLYCGVAGRLYAPLLKANRIEDAKTVRKNLQQKIALMGNPHNWLGEDTVAYFDALAKVNPSQYLAEVKPVIAAVQWAETPQEAELPARLAQRAYAIYFDQGKLDEVAQLHTLLQQALKDAKLTDVARADDRVYTGARLKVLYQKDPAQWLTEAQPFVATAKDVTYFWEMGDQAEAARWAFTPLVKAGRRDEAKALCDQVCADYTRLHADPSYQVETKKWYFNAVSTLPADALLAEMLPVLDSAKSAKVVSELDLALHVLKWVYPTLIGSGKLEDAKAYHVALQASITRLGNPQGLATQELQSYLGALAKAKPELVLAELKPLLEKTDAPATPAEAMERAMLARGAYGPLMTAGRLDEANTLHTRVQEWLTKANKPDDAKADTEAFRQSVSKEAVEAMFTLFKQALAANDADGARKWMANLNMVAPEHPRAAQARKMLKQFEDQQPK